MAKLDGIGQVQADSINTYDEKTYGPGHVDLEALDVEIGPSIENDNALTATAIQYAAAAICAAIIAGAKIMAGKKESGKKVPTSPPPEDLE